jgi:hypothetical protein
MEYSGPFEGATDVSRSALSGFDSADDPNEAIAVTTTGSYEAAEAAISPIEARLHSSAWSRQDVELTIKTVGTIATIAALYLTYQGGR